MSTILSMECAIEKVSHTRPYSAFSSHLFYLLTTTLIYQPTTYHGEVK